MPFLFWREGNVRGEGGEAALPEHSASQPNKESVLRELHKKRKLGPFFANR